MNIEIKKSNIMKRVYLVFPGIWNIVEIQKMKSCVKALGIKIDYHASISEKCNQIVYIDYMQPGKEEEDLFMSALEDAVNGIVYTTEFEDIYSWEEQETYFNN